MRKITFYFLTLLVAIVGLSNVTMSDNGRAGVAGSPGETTCNASGCHSGTGTNGMVSISTTIPATGYESGTTYTITVTVSDSGKSMFGIGVEALNSTNANAGTFVITNASATTLKSKTVNGTARQSVTHQLGGGAGNGSKVFTFNWTAPTATVGNVTFYYAALASDNNGSEDEGDNTYSGSKVFAPASSASTLTATATATPISCNGGSNGTATVVASGGSNYTYLWSNGATTATITNLAANSYSVTVTSGTSTKTSTVTVSQPPMLVTTVNNPAALSCSNTSTVVSVNASGGTSPYTYKWSNNATTAAINVSAAATYVVTVTDANNCTSVKSATVTSSGAMPIAMAGSTQVIGLGGTATLNGSGSSTGADFTYEWTASAGGNIVSGANTLMPVVNAAGTYTLNVTNTQNGCSSTASMAVTTSTVVNIACPSQVSVVAPTGASSAVANYTMPTTNGTCTIGTIAVARISGMASGAVFPIGTTEVCYRATNGCGNADTCCFNVVVTAQGSGGSSCDDITYVATSNNIKIEGLNHLKMEVTVYRKSDFSEVFKCYDNCSASSITIPNLSSGKYYVKVKYLNANYSTFCKKADYVQVGSNITAPDFSNLTFNAVRIGAEVLLKWMSNNIENNDYYTVERSADQQNWTDIATTHTDIDNEGYSIYEETDFTPAKGANFYRLKHTSSDGAVEYSETAIVTFPNPKQFGIYPNPARHEAFIEAETFQGQAVKITILNPLGVIVKTKEGLLNDYDRVKLDIEDLPTGIYTVKIEANSVSASNKLFISKE